MKSRTMHALLRSWRNCALASLFVAVLMAPPGLAAAEMTPDSAGNFMTKLAQQAIAALQATDTTPEAREQAFHQLLTQAFDLDTISRFVVGRHYNQMSAEQRSEYHRLFATFLVKTYARRLGGYSGETLAVVSVRPADDQFVVRTRIERPNGPPIEIDWRLRPADGNYRVVDLVVQGVSMSVAQRQDFASVVSGSGVNGLLAALRARADRLPATAAR